MLAIVLQLVGAGFALHKVYNYLVGAYVGVSMKMSGYMVQVGLANYEKDLIYLHTFPSREARQVPNASPFTVRLQTWLRLHQLKYQVVETWVFSKQSTIPYIIFNGEEVPDSNYIIPYLAKHFNIDITYNIPDAERAIVLAFTRLIEDHLAWTGFYFRYVQNADIFWKVFRRGTTKIIQRFMKTRLQKGVGMACYYRGLGRRSPDEIAEAGVDDVRALSSYLGDKNYFCGEKISRIDCDIFGHLVQMSEVTSMPYPHRAAMEADCQNLLRYIERIKIRLWPDWDSLTTPGEFEN